MRPSIIDSDAWDPVEPFIVYLHRNNDEYLPVEMKGNVPNRFPVAVHQTLDSMGYEIELLYMVDMKTGDSQLMAAREGGAWCTLPLSTYPTEETVRRGRENGAR